MDRLGRSSQEVGFDCLIVVFGMVGGAAAAALEVAFQIELRRQRCYSAWVSYAGRWWTVAGDA